MNDEAPFSLPPIGIWTQALDTVGLPQACELAAELEQLGYGVLWLPEVAGRDVFVSLARILAATSTLIGATGIASIWARDAVAMTGAVKGLTEAHPERVLLGLGVSHQNLVGDLRGHQYERPLATMSDYLDAMDRSPYSALRPTTPVRRVLAALGPKMLELAADKTEGAHPYFVPPEHTAEARKVLGAALLAPEQAVVVETDPVRAREIGRAFCSVYLKQPNYVRNLLRLGFTDDDVAGDGTDRVVDAMVAWGSVEQIVARVADHFAAGADHVCIQAVTPGRRDVPLDQWRALAPALTELGRKVAPRS